MLVSIKKAMQHVVGSTTLVTLGEHRGSVRGIAFSADGRFVATASGDNTAKIWNLELGRHHLTLGSVPENLTGGGVGSGHKHIVTSVSFAPDGRLLASGSYDKTLRIWSLLDGSTLAIMSGHMQIVTSTQWHPTASAVLTASVDSTVRLWRLSKDGSEDWSCFPWGNGVILEFAFAHTQV